MVRGYLQRLLLCLLIASIFVCTHVYGQEQAADDANNIQEGDSADNTEVQQEQQTNMQRRLQEVREARDKALKAEKKRAELLGDLDGESVPLEHTPEKVNEEQGVNEQSNARRKEMEAEYNEAMRLKDSDTLGTQQDEADLHDRPSDNTHHQQELLRKSQHEADQLTAHKMKTKQIKASIAHEKHKQNEEAKIGAHDSQNSHDGAHSQEDAQEGEGVDATELNQDSTGGMVRDPTPEEIELERVRESLKMRMRDNQDGMDKREHGYLTHKEGDKIKDTVHTDTDKGRVANNENTQAQAQAQAHDSANSKDRSEQEKLKLQQHQNNAKLLQEQGEQVRQKSGVKLSGKVEVRPNTGHTEQQIREHQRAMDIAKGAQVRAQAKQREMEQVQARQQARNRAHTHMHTDTETEQESGVPVGEGDGNEVQEDRMAAGDVGDHLFVKARQYFDEYADDAKVISMMKVASKYGSDAASEFLARQHVFGLLDAPSQGYLPEPDVASALPLLTTLVEDKGYPEAQSLAGFLYGSGVGVEIDIAKSVVYMRFAAETGESYASAALGYRYFRGRNVPQDCAKAEELYLVAATAVAEDLKNGMTKPAEMIRLAHDEDQKAQNGMSQWDILQYYQYMAQRGDVQSALIMGQVLLQGAHGMDQDPGAAADYFNAAADAGNAEAKAFLASMHHSGVGVDGSNLTAFKLYKESAEEGNALGQNGLGQMYMLGIVVPQNYEMALKYFTLSAAQGNAEALYNAATMYYSGLGTKVDYKKAFENFSSSARHGYTLALYHLGIMHHLGFGTAKSCDHAVTYFKNIYDRAGHAHMLAEAYSAFKDGDTSRSLMIYMYIAETGSELAQANAGYILDLLATRHGQLTLHSHPKWIPKEDVEAYALLQWIKAAEQRSSEAILKKGDHFYFGWGVNASHTTAVECYRTAGTMHNAQALFNIGYMTERGEGVPQDFALAKRYYDQSKEVSQDAKVPVYIALVGLRARELYAEFVRIAKEESVYKINFENGILHGINELYQEIHPARAWGPDWEYMVMFLLFIVLITLIHIRRMFYSIEAFEAEQARQALAQATAQARG